jgi:DNA-binding XRE family transcriptional regulator
MTAEQYKAARERLGVTQSKLADILGITRETVTRRETGAATITSEAAMAIRSIPVPKGDPDVAVAAARRDEKPVPLRSVRTRLGI